MSSLHSRLTNRWGSKVVIGWKSKTVPMPRANANVREPTFTLATSSAPVAFTEQLLSDLKILQDRYFHPPRKASPEAKLEFWLAQCEMWKLANALVALVNPDLQWPIDMYRAHIIYQLKADVPSGYVMKRNKAATGEKVPRPMLWQDIDITPEVACDPTLTGSAALASDVKHLRALLREQRALVSQLLSKQTSTRAR